MSKLNLLVHVNSYEDVTATNDPNLSSFKWTRDLQGLDGQNPESRIFVLGSGQKYTIFSSTVTTSDDATTTWDIGLAPGSSTVYRIKHAGGTAPLFRTPRTEGHDATTEVTVTQNSGLLTFIATGGTIWDLIAAGVQVGDEVFIGPAFSPQNQGKFKILTFDQTSFTVENPLGVPEGPVVLGANFEKEVDIISADGVQVYDKIDIVAGFSVLTQGQYDIVEVGSDFIDISSAQSLPTETGVSNNPKAFVIYRSLKSFLFLETDQKLKVTLNGTSNFDIDVLRAGVNPQRGLFLMSSPMNRIEIENVSDSAASIFFAVTE